MLGCAPCSDNAVERKNRIDKHDLPDRLPETERFLVDGTRIGIFTFKFVMYFLYRLVYQEEAADEHHQTRQVETFAEPFFRNNVFTFLFQ